MRKISLDVSSKSCPPPAQEGAAGHVHSPGGKCSTYRFPPGAEGDPHRKQQLVRPHRLGRRVSSFTTPPTLPSPISGTNYQLVWSDEFNGTSVDASKWNKVGPWGKPVASHWANYSYLTSNVSEANGLATITVQKSGSNWTGGGSLARTRPRFFGMGLWKCVPSCRQ